MDREEQLEVVNEHGEVLGIACRSFIHGDPSLMHRVIHVLVFNAKNELLLQKRSLNKDAAPGRWDTSVGGHVGVGEALSCSAEREMEEELGITGCEMEYLYSHIYSNHYETELVTTYRCVYDGPITTISFNRDEIDEIRFWGIDEIRQGMGKQILSDHFEDEYRRYLCYTPLRSGP
ncbi:MAG: NUDIX domain-containing protein [Thermodesulfovibrionales bacterium]|jgi:isopentenyldiphosphate isomerase